VTGSASDLVKITLSGSHEVKKVEIDPKCVDANAVDALEDLVHAALQDAMKKVDDAVQIPGIPGFGF